VARRTTERHAAGGRRAASSCADEMAGTLVRPTRETLLVSPPSSSPVVPDRAPTTAVQEEP